MTGQLGFLNNIIITMIIWSRNLDEKYYTSFVQGFEMSLDISKKVLISS